MRSQESPEPFQPRVDIPEWCRVQRVHPARPVDSHRGEPALAQHAKMLRHRGLGDVEFLLDYSDYVARFVLVASEQLQYATADRVAEYVEGLHYSSGVRCTPV